MITVSSNEELRAEVRNLKRSGQRIGFVPTMGYLHEGHLSLVRLAAKHCDKVFVSIFVNPTQFNDPKDYEKYPIDLERDAAMLKSEKVHLLYTPNRESIYGAANSSVPYQSWVSLDKLPNDHEGACRPGHFRGVSTVVSILFNLVQPEIAVFGEKDFQQLRIIEQMVEDLKYDIKIIRGPLIREADGLAMSSRNVRLSSAARKAALLLSQGLQTAVAAYKEGERSVATLCGLVQECLDSSPMVKTEYVKLVDEGNLDALDEIKGTPRLIVAAFVDSVRLIDNMAL